jgi:uncharacterized small protein (DUF1192 family)
MKKTYGMCFGLLAMGLAVLGAPASRAQSLMAAREPAGPSEPTTAAVAAAPAASSPADLDSRIDALETELSELKAELEAEKAEEAAAPAVVAAPATPAQEKPAEKTTIASLLGPTSVSGFVDGYYQVNFNHPNQAAPNNYGGVDFRVFDFRDKSINLNMAELILDKAPASDSAIGRTGYHVSLGFGDGMNVVNSFDPAGRGFAQYLKEAYVSYLAPVGKGLQVDFGKFVTPMGAEVIESKDNWNYSRGILFGYAIPFYHFGLRAKYAFNDKYSLTGFLVNGWNNVVDNNSGKTYGFSFGATPTKQWSYTVNYLAGPETTAGSFGLNSAGTAPVNVNGTWRQTWDAVAMYTPNSQWSFMANYDYGRGDRVVTGVDDTTGLDTLSDPVSWWGFAGYAKYSPDANDYFAARYEYFDDPDGFTATSSIPGCSVFDICSSGPISFIPSTAFGPAGVKNLHFNEFTITYQRTLASYLLTRFEYRRDMSDYPVYAISNFEPGVKNQDTASISLILLFDSRNAK